jgi:2-methylcitrate dehydratase PrpD
LIDCALALREAVGDPSAIRSVEVSSYRDAVQVCDRLTPLTPVQAKFSLQHASAVCLLKGRPTLGDFDLPDADTDLLAALRARVVLREDPELTAAYPARFGAAMRIELEDGRCLQHGFSDALGDPERPLDRTAIVDKAKVLLEHSGYSPAQAHERIAACLGAQAHDDWPALCTPFSSLTSNAQ